MLVARQDDDDDDDDTIFNTINFQSLYGFKYSYRIQIIFQKF